MREHIDDESVDLIYLDPPFNSRRLYNAFIDGAQWIAFDETWRRHEAIDDFHAVAGAGATLPPPCCMTTRRNTSPATARPTCA